MNLKTSLLLQWLISRAELTGSRGRARKYGHEEPPDSDYDWSIFTDDKLYHRLVVAKLAQLVTEEPLFRLITRRDGFTAHAPELGIDINLYPMMHRRVLHLAWEYVELGYSPEYAWKEAHKDLNYPMD